MVTDRIGIAVSERAARAVLRRRSRVLWTREAAIEPGADITPVIESLLRAVPRSRFRRAPAVGAAIGPSGAQVKRLAGLPPADRAGAITDAVRLNTRRFFAQNGRALVTSMAIRRGTDWWCGALDAPTIDAAAAACKRVKLRLTACAPVVAALGAVLYDGRFAWLDGVVADDVTLEKGVCTQALRRLPCAGKPPALRRQFSGAGDGALHFADAIAASFVGERSPFAVDPGSAARSRRRHRGARACFGALAVAAALVAGAGPGARAMLMERRANARLAELGVTALPALDAVREIEAVTAASRRVHDFSASRRSASAFIRAIAAALPDSATIVTLRVDSLSATVVILAAADAPVVAALARVPGVLQATVSGAVTRESVGGASLQRTSVALRMSPPAPGGGGPRALAQAAP